MLPYLYFSKEGANYQHALIGCPPTSTFLRRGSLRRLGGGDDDQIVPLVREIIQGENDSDEAIAALASLLLTWIKRAFPNGKGSRRAIRQLE